MCSATAETCDFVANLNQIDDAGQRCAWWLSNTYRDAKGKRIANDFGVSERTARLWLAGKMPEAEYLDRMARRFGWRFVNFVLNRMPIDLRLDTQADILRHRQKEQERNDALDRPQNTGSASTAGAMASGPGVGLEAGHIAKADGEKE